MINILTNVLFYVVVYKQIFYVSRSLFLVIEGPRIALRCASWTNMLLRERVKLELILLQSLGHVKVSDLFLSHDLY